MPLILEAQFNESAGFTEKDVCLPQFIYTEVLETANTTFDLSAAELAQTLEFDMPG